MALSIDIPKRAEEVLRSQWQDLEQAAKEALLIESYRTGKVSVGFLAEMLGMAVVEAQAWLSRRGVPLNYSIDDLATDQQTLSRVLGGNG